MSTTSEQINSPVNRQMQLDGSSPFTHPDTPYLIKHLNYLDRLVLHELVAQGKRFATLTESDVANLFL